MKEKKGINIDYITLGFAVAAMLVVYVTPRGNESTIKDSKTEQLIRKIHSENKILRDERPAVAGLTERINDVVKLNSNSSQPEVIERHRKSAIMRIVKERQREFIIRMKDLETYLKE